MKVSKFEVGDYAGVSKYKNVFAEIYALNLLEEVFVNKNFEKNVLWTYVVSDFNSDDIFGIFCEKKKCKRQIKQNLGH